MFRSLRLFSLVLFVLSASVPVLATAVEQESLGGAIVLSDSVSAKVTIVDVNKKERRITLRNDEGDEQELIVSEQVRNFDQIKKGDIVEVEYVRAAATVLEKLSDTNIASQTTDVVRAPAGAKPGVAAMQTSSIVADVLAIDTEKRLLTLQGPRGGIVTVIVPAEMKNFDSLKKGDRISAIYSEAIAISVKTPEKKK